MKQRPLYLELASLIDAYHRCVEKGNEYADKHEERIESLVKEHMPSGSGIDCGTEIDIDKSTGEKLVFTMSYHHMNDGGMYDGWTEHSIIVTPAFICGPRIKITGRNRNGIKDYLHDVYSEAIETVIN